PRNESADADLGLLRPAPDEIHHLIPHIMRYPGRGQSSPRLFFNAMCSAISSARTSSLVCTFFLFQELNLFLLLLRLAARTFRRLEGSCSVLEELLLPAVKHGGLQPQFLTQIGNRNLV